MEVEPIRRIGPDQLNGRDNLRFMVDPRLAEGKRAEFNVSFGKEKVSYAIALRNGVVAITG